MRSSINRAVVVAVGIYEPLCGELRKEAAQGRNLLHELHRAPERSPCRAAVIPAETAPKHRWLEAVQVKFAPMPVYCQQAREIVHNEGAMVGALVMKRHTHEYLCWTTEPDLMVKRVERLHESGAIPVAVLSIIEAAGGVRLRIRPIRELADAEGIDILLDRLLDCIEQLPEFSRAPQFH
jgi:hypothetical protein